MIMSTVFALLLLSHFVKSQNLYCIWNHQGTKTIVNGQYTLDSTVNSQPAYVKQIGDRCSSPTLYLWRNSAANAWQLSSITFTNEYIMQCTKTNLAECTAGNWGAQYPNVYAQTGLCPEWNCGIITTTETHYGCDGPFDVDVGHNAWKHSSEDIYFYFAPHVFKWMCYSAMEQNICPATAYLASDVSSWTQLAYGQSSATGFTLMGTNGIESGNFQINCVAPNPTIKPTMNPTKRPTNNPSTKPTNQPTKKPTAKPTNNPTKKPITNPTKKPTSNPTKKPTANPTKSPTNKPSVSMESSSTQEEMKNEEDHNDEIEVVGYNFERRSLFWGMVFGILICSFLCCCMLICQKICCPDNSGKRDRVPDDDDETEMIRRYR